MLVGAAASYLLRPPVAQQQLDDLDFYPDIFILPISKDLIINLVSLSAKINCVVYVCNNRSIAAC